MKLEEVDQTQHPYVSNKNSILLNYYQLDGTGTA